MSALKENIIQSALLLFEEHGFHGVTVNDIVAHSHTSKGGFYHHFQSKDELLFMIHDIFISYVLEKANQANEQYKRPTFKLQAIIKSFVKVFDLYKPHISVFYQESTYLKPHYEKLIKEKRDQFKTIVFHVIEEGQNIGEFRKQLPINITGMSILGMVNWTYKWYKKNGGKTIEEIADIFVDFIMHGILTEEARNDEEFKPMFLENSFF